MTCGSLCAHWTTPEWLAGAQGQPRRSDETSRMSALPLTATECCTVLVSAQGQSAGPAPKKGGLSDFMSVLALGASLAGSISPRPHLRVKMRPR
jgi:hypothetical protein